MLDNRTPFAVEALAQLNTEAQLCWSVIAKASLEYEPCGRLRFANYQPDIRLTGQHRGELHRSSLLFEQEASLLKPAADVLVSGSAYAPSGSAREAEVSIHVGALRHRIAVFGARRWLKYGGRYVASSPERFQRVSLCYENAFGGCAPNADREDAPRDDRNPAGKGFFLGEAEGVSLPELEAPERLIVSPTDRPAPVALGPIASFWEPRRSWAGTFDDCWEEERYPAMPLDFDRRYYCGAHPALQVEGGLRGDEWVRVEGVLPTSAMEFQLPLKLHPSVTVLLTEGWCSLDMMLDTLCLDADARRITLLWRGHTAALETQEVRTTLVSTEEG